MHNKCNMQSYFLRRSLGEIRGSFVAFALCIVRTHCRGMFAKGQSSGIEKHARVYSHCCKIISALSCVVSILDATAFIFFRRLRCDLLKVYDFIVNYRERATYANICSFLCVFNAEILYFERI